MAYSRLRTLMDNDLLVLGKVVFLNTRTKLEYPDKGDELSRTESKKAQ